VEGNPTAGEQRRSVGRIARCSGTYQHRGRIFIAQSLDSAANTLNSNRFKSRAFSAPAGKRL
jgi:hypothetical protein